MEVFIHLSDHSGFCELYYEEKKMQMVFVSAIKHGDNISFYFSDLPEGSFLVDEIDTIKYHFDQEVCFSHSFQFLQLSFSYCEDLENKNNFEAFRGYCQYFDRNPPK